jgi:hypothetical protein
MSVNFSEYHRIIRKWHEEPFQPSGDAEIDGFIREIGDGTAVAMQAEADGRVAEALVAMRVLTPLVDKYSDLVARPDLFETHLRIIERLANAKSV